MTARAAFVLLVCLAACGPQTQSAQPHLGLGVGLGPHGLRVVPRVTTRVNGVSLGAGANGATVGTNVGGVGVGVGL